ncbi:MAG TPA: hypothetical protein VMX75_06020 [Spirochaetia bacterium]|nr:hypothetical protein [Spirochaetia bacterium]
MKMINSWELETRKGVKNLSRHKPEAALKCFYAALRDCPVSQTRELSRILFYLGITLKRLGCLDGAIKSWLGSQRLTKDYYSLKMIKRFANFYGMERQRSEALDDWRAFYSIHMVRYLNGKRTKRFCCKAERDMIKDLIGDSWKSLKMRGILKDKSPEEKKRVFRGVRIVFPFLLLHENQDNPIIHVDFHNKRLVEPGDRCPCGSGLSFMGCCGRLPGETELQSGIF